MRFLVALSYIVFFSLSAHAAPAIQYKADQQSYSFPESTIPTATFFTEISEYSGIEIYYYSKLIIPDLFRGITVEEDDLLRLFDKQFSVIKSFKADKLASMQILPTGQFNSDSLRRAGAPIIETNVSSETVQESPVLLTDQRVRVLKAKAKKEQAIAKIKERKATLKEEKEKRKAERKLRKQRELAQRKQEDLAELKHFHDTDKKIYERLLPFYKHKFGEPDFSEIENKTEPK